jgi:hypothetical protein
LRVIWACARRKERQAPSSVSVSCCVVVTGQV